MEKITITTIIKDLLEWFQDGEKYKHDDLGGFVEDIYGSSILNLGLTIEEVDTLLELHEFLYKLWLDKEEKK